MWRGKTLKGSKHSCGFPAPPANKNPAAILLNLIINRSLGAAYAEIMANPFYDFCMS